MYFQFCEPRRKSKNKSRYLYHHYFQFLCSPAESDQKLVIQLLASKYHLRDFFLEPLREPIVAGRVSWRSRFYMKISMQEVYYRVILGSMPVGKGRKQDLGEGETEVRCSLNKGLRWSFRNLRNWASSSEFSECGWGYRLPLYKGCDPWSNGSLQPKAISKECWQLRVLS